jgi:site-specific recombinase XerC
VTELGLQRCHQGRRTNCVSRQASNGSLVIGGFEEWLTKAGVRGRYSPHRCRHAFALGLYERAGDVLAVQAALGHRALSSTLVYARASAERVLADVVG